MTTPNASTTDRALRGLRHLGLAQLATQIITWSLTAITVHILTPRDYGLIATAGMFTLFAQMLIDGGLTEVLVAHRDLSERMHGAAISAVFLFATLVGVILFGFAPLAAKFFHSPPLKKILEVSAFYLPLTALGFAPGVLLTKEMQFNHLGRIQVITGVFQGVFTLTLAFFGATYWALIVGTFSGTACRIILSWIALDKRPFPNLHFSALRPLFFNSRQMIGQRFSYFSVDNLDIFLLSHYWGSIELGPYSVARTLAHTALDKISGVTRGICIPAFAAKTDADAQLRGLINVISVTATVTFPLFWIMGAVSQIALPLIFGTRWIRMIVPFISFASILPLRTIYTLMSSSLIGTGRFGLTSRNYLIWLAVLTPFLAVGVQNGAVGVAISWASAFPIIFFMTSRKIAHALSIPLSILFKPLVSPAFCAAMSAAIAEILFLVLPTHLSPFLALSLQCGLATLSYFVLLRCVSPIQLTQTVSVLKRTMQ